MKAGLAGSTSRRRIPSSLAGSRRRRGFHRPTRHFGARAEFPLADRSSYGVLAWCISLVQSVQKLAITRSLKRGAPRFLKLTPAGNRSVTDGKRIALPDEGEASGTN